MAKSRRCGILLQGVILRFGFSWIFWVESLIFDVVGNSFCFVADCVF